MKFEIEVELQNGCHKSFVTKDYVKYEPDYKRLNGLYQIGFVKDGKTRTTWTPVKADKYDHNVKEIKISEATTGRVIEVIKCEH